MSAGVYDASLNNPYPIATRAGSREFASKGGFAITPDDNADLTHPVRAIYVGSDAGNVRVVTVSDDTLTFIGVPIGTIIPIAAKRVKSTGTTSTNLVGLA